MSKKIQFDQSRLVAIFVLFPRLPDEVWRPDDGEVLGRHARLGRVRGDAVEVQHQVVQRPETTTTKQLISRADIIHSLAHI